ncbi:unnamed protein product, partial [Brassica oleracea var. botrytis]
LFTFVCFLGNIHQVKMLLDATRFYSPGLQALGIQVCGAAGSNWYPLPPLA